MNRGAAALSIAVSLLSGCGMDRMASPRELEWIPSKLTMEKCPDLNGDYYYKITPHQRGGYTTDLIDFYAGSISVRARTGNFNPATGFPRAPINVESLPRWQSYYDLGFSGNMNRAKKTKSENTSQGRLHIEQTATTLIRGEVNETRLVTNLGTEMAGCADGALILRYLENLGGQEFVSRTVWHGEFELRKNSDDSLTITRRRRERAVSFASGLLGPAKEHSVVTQTYPLASKR